MAEPKISELFSSRSAAQILQRTQFCMWYHATHNLKDMRPININGQLFFTRGMLRRLVELHLRLKPGETQELLLARIEQAKSADVS